MGTHDQRREVGKSTCKKVTYICRLVGGKIKAERNSYKQKGGSIGRFDCQGNESRLSRWTQVEKILADDAARKHEVETLRTC